jgi:hypothetical protein
VKVIRRSPTRYVPAAPIAAARTGAAEAVLLGLLVLLGLVAADLAADAAVPATWFGAPPQAAASIAVASTTTIALSLALAGATAASYASPRSPAAWSRQRRSRQGVVAARRSRQGVRVQP